MSFSPLRVLKFQETPCFLLNCVRASGEPGTHNPGLVSESWHSRHWSHGSQKQPAGPFSPVKEGQGRRPGILRGGWGHPSFQVLDSTESSCKQKRAGLAAQPWGQAHREASGSPKPLHHSGQPAQTSLRRGHFLQSPSRPSAPHALAPVCLLKPPLFISTQNAWCNH